MIRAQRAAMCCRYCTARCRIWKKCTPIRRHRQNSAAVRTGISSRGARRSPCSWHIPTASPKAAAACRPIRRSARRGDGRQSRPATRARNAHARPGAVGAFSRDRCAARCAQPPRGGPGARCRSAGHRHAGSPVSPMKLRGTTCAGIRQRPRKSRSHPPPDFSRSLAGTGSAWPRRSRAGRRSFGGRFGRARPRIVAARPGRHHPAGPPPALVRHYAPEHAWPAFDARPSFQELFATALPAQTFTGRSHKLPPAI